jgi:pyruvate/2-oxoglutarate/acetoin dehydrogenase E1 component
MLRLSRRAGARVTGKDVPMPYAANLEKLALPQVEDRRCAKAVTVPRGGLCRSTS